MPRATKSTLVWLAQILCLAIAYFITGRLSQLLASPPGNVMAVYPPAGLGLAFVLIGGYRFWIGIWVGSFAFNSWAFMSAVDAGAASPTSASAMAAAMAFGAALQAIVSAALIHRVLSIRTSLDRGEDIGKLLGIGGPLGCAISPTIGVTTLLIGGVIPAGAWPLAWTTWWVGDTIGVLIVMPLILVGWLQPAARRLRWLAAIALPVSVAVVISIILFLIVRNVQEDRMRLAFERRSDLAEQALRENVVVHFEVLHSIRSYFHSVENVTRDGFRHFVERSHDRHRGIQALEWIPRVSSAERASYEHAARADGFDGFQFTERQPDGELRPAANRDEYFPVFYVEPLADNENAVGYDLASNPARRRALELARDTGQPVATAPITLVQETGEQLGFLVIVAVYSDEHESDTIGRRRANLRGHVVGVFRMGHLIETSLQQLEPPEFGLCVFEAMTTGDDQTLYCLSDQVRAASTGESTGGNDSFPATRIVDVADRKWRLELTPTASFKAGYQTWLSWGVLASSLLVTGLLEAFLLLVTGRTARIEELVAQRTEELRISRDIAEAANRSKSEFLANMSHELRTPLNAIMGYSQLLQDEVRDRGQTELVPDLDRIYGAGKHLLGLIEGVLDLSKIESGRMDMDRAPFDVPTLVKEVTATVRPMASENGNTLKVECPPEPWTIVGDQVKLRQVLLNLLSNATKFTENGTITLSVSAETDGSGDWVRWDVADTGIGIAADRIDAMFEEFTQVDSSTTRKYGGTGLGLAISRRFCEMMGGDLRVASTPGRGSTFTLRIPRTEGDELGTGADS